MAIRAATSTNHIPNEITEGILIRLPIASVLRLKALCKSWHSAICSPYLEKNYHLLNSLISKTPADIMLVRPPNRRSIFVLPQDSIKSDNLQGDELIIHPSKLPNPIPSVSYMYPIDHRPDGMMGTCNGLVCLHYGYVSGYFTIAFWNPITNKFNQLPARKHKSNRFLLALGFGYDSINDDYKVVIIEEEGERREKPKPRPVLVCSRSTNSWKYIESVREFWFLRECSLGKYLNGALHWMAVNSSETTNVIFALDLATETFRYDIRLPGGYKHYYRRSLGELCVLDGCLCVLCFNDLDRITHSSFEVWVMKEYGNRDSWTKLFNSTTTTSCMHHYQPKTPLWNFGEYGMVSMKDPAWKIVTHEDLNYKDVKRTKLCYLPDPKMNGWRKNIDFNDGYVPSLVSPSRRI